MTASGQSALNPIEIIANFTAEPIAEFFEFWQTELGVKGSVVFAPYGQVFQTLLAKQDAKPSVLLLRLEDWLTKQENSPEKVFAEWERSIAELSAALRQVRERSSAPLWVCVCPPSPWIANHDLQAVHEGAERALYQSLAGMRDVFAVSGSEVLNRYRVTDYHDEVGDAEGHIPYNREFFCALATLLCRRIYGGSSASCKMIVLDCDGTLWDGVCGEEGLGVRVHPEHRHFQEFMLRQMQAGRILVLCSRNREQDVLEVLRKHPDMVLREEHIVAHRINWGSKADNIQSLAQELRVGLDRIVFVDDNPLECAEVQARFPAVLALQTPSERTSIAHWLDHVWVFDQTSTTQEDRSRTQFYAEDALRQSARKDALTLAGFIEGLQLEINVIRATLQDAKRVAQLSERTTQFNISGRRYTSTEIEALLNDPSYACFVTTVKDRFGDYGLVGAMIIRWGTVVELDALYLSCRALGRGVEHVMLATVACMVSERSVATFRVNVVTTARNIPARMFMERVAAQHKQDTADDIAVYLCPADHYRQLRYMPQDEPSAEQVSVRNEEPPQAQTTTSLRFFSPQRSYALSSAQAILEEMQRTKQRDIKSITERAHEVTPGDPVEQALVNMWSDTIGCPVGVTDNFYDLGGHSLHAMQILARVRRELSIKLTLETFFEYLTIAELAREIRLRKAS